MHLISTTIAEADVDQLIEPVRMTNGGWTVRVFNPTRHFMAVLSPEHAARIETEVFRLGAHRVAARIRLARKIASRRAQTADTRDEGRNERNT